MNKWQETTVGRIPSYWEFKKVSDCGLHIGDGNYSSKYPRQKELLSEGVPFISSTDLVNGKVTYDNLRYISPEQHRTLLKGHIKTNDVLIVVRGNGVGDVALVDEQFDGANINAQLAYFRGNENYSGPFLYYLLHSYNQRGVTERYVSGSAQPQITVRALNQIYLTLPPLPEQEAITAVLSALDDKIDLLHRQNKTLESLAQTLFRHWIIDNADDDGVDGVIPDEFDFTMGLSPPGSSYNEDGEGVPMFQGNADFGFRFPENRVYTTDPRRFAEQYDTLISVRAPVGAQNMAFEKCCIGRGVAAFRYKRNPSYYTYAYFKLRSLMEEIRQFNNEGTVFGSISKRDFMAFEITIPSYEAVDQFQTSVKPIDGKVIANCKQIRTLEKLRDTLLPKLMSGEIRVAI